MEGLESISLNPTIQERPTSGAIRFIKERDRHSFYPIIINGRLEGLEYGGPAYKGNVHHIHPVYHLTKYRAGTDMNHPANLLTLERKRHNAIHRDWINRYEDLSVVDPERARWEDSLDEYFAAMAIVNSYDYLMVHEELPYFDDYSQDIVNLIELVDDDFVDRYRWFKQDLKLS